jgi:hypothetical protein
VETKSDQIRRALAAGECLSALRIAARFHDRSNDTKTYKRGLDAHNNPAFYRQLGKDPEQLTARAFALLEIRFRPGSSGRSADEQCGHLTTRKLALIKR